MIVVTTCCVNSGLFSILALVMDLARNKGYEDESVAITLIMLTFVSSVAGRMFVGGVNLIPRMHSVLLLTGCGVMASVALITVAMATEFYTLVIGLVMVGSAMGGCTTIYAKCILDTSTVTLESYPLALGIANTSEGVFDALVPVLVATAVDTHGTYLYAFSILSGLCVSTAVVLSLTFVCVVLRKTG
ncbi:uncharacterized protein LOC106011151 [Aplysia californica]|uniref:Uncharacterized protein LOC106011151 n=1 Tax=Aplysia californica TaxID=6500 RepID=A0ABM0ZVC0_APLCA|nr:uncharacterized protein LOC106011151 [Aplysia californica]